MTHSVTSTVPPVAIIILKTFVYKILKNWDRRTKDICENNDHYWPLLWVGLVDQLQR